MWTVISWVLTGIGAVALACLLLAFVAMFGYRRLSINFGSLRFVPEFQINAMSIAGAVVNAALRNFIPAAGNLLKGIRLEGTSILENKSPIILFIPDISYSVSIDNRQVCRPCSLQSFWLKGGKAKILPITMNLNKEDISKILVSGMRGRGKIAIGIQVSASFGRFSYRRDLTQQLNMPDVLRSALRHEGR